MQVLEDLHEHACTSHLLRHYHRKVGNEWLNPLGRRCHIQKTRANLREVGGFLPELSQSSSRPQQLMAIRHGGLSKKLINRLIKKSKIQPRSLAAQWISHRESL
jgi:hypothetical protein